MTPCDTCNGSAWFWWETARVWVACADCNDDGLAPKPKVANLSLELLN